LKGDNKLEIIFRIIEMISFAMPVILCGAVGAAFFWTLLQIYYCVHPYDRPKKKKDE